MLLLLQNSQRRVPCPRSRGHVSVHPSRKSGRAGRARRSIQSLQDYPAIPFLKLFSHMQQKTLFVIVSALKGRNKLAQGNALGNSVPQVFEP